jgi:hypothetical protein
MSQHLPGGAPAEPRCGNPSIEPEQMTERMCRMLGQTLGGSRVAERLAAAGGRRPAAV